jgi:hypoxanthine phosphoribosyltransferase
MIAAARLRARVAELAGEIDRDLDGEPAILAGVLTGAVFFLCDLARMVQSSVTIDFLQFASYGAGRAPQGRPTLLRGLSTDPAGLPVILVEDVIDSGATLAAARAHLAQRGAARVRVCSLLRKPSARRAGISVDYLGFDIDEEFVVGYGLDHAGAYRNLPYVAALPAEER